MNETTRTRLDHIIYLVPYHQLVEPPSWLATNFTITPGGRHADGKTENKLILFRDGSYIELIAFINDDPDHMSGHWWGNKKPGIIDYAFTTDGDADEHWKAMHSRFSDLAKGLGSRYDYAAPVAGGRRRDDGVEVQWKVTFPEGVKRGELPFFCHDVTPRQLRVNVTEESVSHPCGAYGVRELTATLRNLDEVPQIYSAVFGKHIHLAQGPDEFIIGTATGSRDPVHPSIRLHPSRNDDQKLTIEQEGVVFDRLILGVVPDSGSTKPILDPFRLNPEGERLQIWLA